jgi:hypothetical protein
LAAGRFGPEGEDGPAGRGAGQWGERERGEVEGFLFFNLFKFKHLKLFSKFSKTY